MCNPKPVPGSGDLQPEAMLEFVATPLPLSKSSLTLAQASSFNSSLRARSKEAVYESSRSIAGLDLPYSMNILKWGKIISMQDDTFRISYKSEEGSSYILVVNCLTQTHHLVEVLLEDGRSINLTFEDTYRVRTSHPVSSTGMDWTLRLLSSGRVRTARMEWMVYSAELNEKDR